MTLTDWIKQVQSKANSAHKIVCDLAIGKHEWRMSIPVRAEDSDMTLQAPLDDLATALKIIEVQAKAIEEYADRKNWRYQANNDVGAFDAWLDFKPDHYCKEHNELGGYTARQAQTEVNEILSSDKSNYRE